MKKVITAIDGNLNISPRNVSNNYGSAFIWAGNLNADISHSHNDIIEDTAYLFWRADNREQPTGVNLYGGFKNKEEREMNIKSKNEYAIEKILGAKNLVSLKYDTHWINRRGDHDNVGLALCRRPDVPTYIKEMLMSVDWHSVPTIKDTDFNFKKIAIGNSHTPSFTDHNSICVKTDGTTLHSQLKTDFEYVRRNIAAMPNKPEKVTMTFMDIDVRFHILRLGIDWKSMVDQWKHFGDSLGCEVEYAAPLPVETENRKHPKTGAYPAGSEIYFYGTQEERKELVLRIKDYMYKIGMNVLQVPEMWYEIDPQAFEDNMMEKPRSVHLAPHSYRRNIGF